MPSNWFTLRHLFNFSWRASRTEFFLLHIILLMAIYAPIMLLVMMFDIRGEADSEGSALMAAFGTLWFIVMLAGFIAMLAVNVRRLHDQEKSGWFWLATWVPLIGWIFWLVFAFTPGDPGENLYGPDPRGGGTPAPSADAIASIFD